MSNEEQLLPTFERFRKALFDSDVETLRDMIADDYQGFDPEGRPQGKEMMLEAYRPGGVALERYDVEDLRARIIGDVGIVTGTGRVEGRYVEFHFAHHVRFVDLYVHRDGRWQLYLGQVTPLGT
jgi:ketosteroid isomerase-like protein